MPDLEKVSAYIAAEWAVIASAPVTFAAQTVVIFGVVWLLQRWAYGTVLNHRIDRIASLEERVRMREDQLNNKLQTTPPDEAQKLIAKLQETIKRTIGSEWAPLTAAEEEALTREAAPLKKRRIQVMYVNSFGKDLARTLRNAFRSAGWEAELTMGSGFEAGIFVGWSPLIAAEVKAAIESAAPRLTVTHFPQSGGGEFVDGPDQGVFLAVGTNPA